MRKNFLIKNPCVKLLVFLFVALLCFRATETYAVGVQSETENPLLGKLIVVDPGHGGGTGAHGSYLVEDEVNLNVSLRLRDLLEEANATVNMTRTEDVNVLLSDRTDLANNLGADIFVCIHCNAFTNPLANGTETFYYDGTGPRVEASKTLATYIQTELISALGTRNRGVKGDYTWLGYHLYVLTNTNMPAILTELAFLTNLQDEEKLGDDTMRQMAAEAIFNGIKSYFERHLKATVSVPTENILTYESFSVNATIYNPDTINVTQVNATLTAPEGVERISGPWTQNIGNITGGENRSVQWTLMAIEEGSYNLTVTITSFNYPAFNATPTPINVTFQPPYTGDVSISHPATKSIYEIKLEFNATLRAGNITMKFYSYSGNFQAESNVWNGTTPTHLELIIQVPHPSNLSVEIATLVLTGEGGKEIYTITTFIMGRSHIIERLAKIDEDWLGASPTERTAMFREIVDIDAQWPYAPS